MGKVRLREVRSGMAGWVRFGPSRRGTFGYGSVRQAWSVVVLLGTTWQGVAGLVGRFLK